MHHKSYLFPHRLAWQKTTLIHKRQFSDPIKSWIYEQGSLTKRLRQRYAERFRVKILFQQWTQPTIDESRLLNLKAHSHCLIREVALQVDDSPLILARSIIPKSTIKIAARKLRNLGTRPLGEVIFAYHDLSRESLETIRLHPDHFKPPCSRQYHIKQSIWGRRTCYAIQKQRLLVSEFFLPALYD